MREEEMLFVTLPKALPAVVDGCTIVVALEPISLFSFCDAYHQG
jgi:hypothetical protein